MKITSVEYVEVRIDPYLDADGVRVYKGGELVINETRENRIEAFEAVKRWIENQIELEYQKRGQVYAKRS